MPEDLFPTRLRLIREQRGFTQAQLATEAGLPATTISHFEAGSRKPSFDNLRRLSKTLNVSSDYLMGITDTQEATGAASRIARHLGNASKEDIAFLEQMAQAMANKSKPNDE
ncbi:helix-turn-helix domain-containing protein [Dyella koreensis]|uniref:Helix-turn-helix transcriptional regulator n=1 Tax=Dyella koreensis TaxID=311235 RepID=A0ABW8K7U9_9GAMM